MDKEQLEEAEFSDFNQSAIIFSEKQYDPSMVKDFGLKDEEALRVPVDKRTTRNVMTKYEKTRILCERAEQLRHGAPPKIEITEKLQKRLPRNNFAYEDIAREELNEKKIPIIVRRYLPNGRFEEWHLNELAIPFY